jgi:hypothetical protein
MRKSKFACEARSPFHAGIILIVKSIVVSFGTQPSQQPVTARGKARHGSAALIQTLLHRNAPYLTSMAVNNLTSMD